MSKKVNLKNETANSTKKSVLSEVLCPECGRKVKFIFDMNTDWYGNLKHYWCRNCEEMFVSQNGDELEIADR
jgi:rubredoxin